MRPDLAVRLLKSNCGVEVTNSEARSILARDDKMAIRLAAANLRDLKNTMALSDSAAYVGYAMNVRGIGLWKEGRRDDIAAGLEREAGFAHKFDLAEKFWSQQ